MVGSCVKVHDFKVYTGYTSAAMITAAVSEAVHQAIRSCSPVLSEPIMDLKIYCEEDYLGKGHFIPYTTDTG